MIKCFITAPVLCVAGFFALAAAASPERADTARATPPGAPTRTAYCGQELQDVLQSTLDKVIAGHRNVTSTGWSGQWRKAQLCSLPDLARDWDMSYSNRCMPFKGTDGRLHICGESVCQECVQVGGSKQWWFDVNYAMWGVIAKLCYASKWQAVQVAKAAKHVRSKGNEWSAATQWFIEFGWEYANSGVSLSQYQSKFPMPDTQYNYKHVCTACSSKAGGPAYEFQWVGRGSDWFFSPEWDDAHSKEGSETP